jgi:tagatose-1,6-bisphosphate aldolase non-catalytic subunit AgaZ/GatZ
MSYYHCGYLLALLKPRRLKAKEGFQKMPAIVSTKNLNDAETEKKVRAAVENLFKNYPEDWRVAIRGGIDNEAWEIKVTPSDGRKTWVHILRGEKSEDNVEAVVQALKGIIVELPLNA